MDYIAYKHIQAGERDAFLRRFALVPLRENPIDYLVLLGEYSFAFDDFSLYTDEHKVALDTLIQQFYRSNHHTTPWIAGVYTAVKLAEQHYQDERYLQALIDLREYLFAHNLRKGTLVMSSTCREARAEVLSVCAPYIIFDAEDLVVVSAFEELKTTSFFQDEETLLHILLYALIKREFDFVRQWLWYYQEHYGITDATSCSGEQQNSLYRYILWKFQQTMGKPILHKPYGNSNPYLPQPYERFPKIVSSDDRIIIQAVCQGNKTPTLYLTEDDGSTSKYSGVLKGAQKGSWEFLVGPFDSGEFSYYISQEEYQTEVYTCTIFEKLPLSAEVLCQVCPIEGGGKCMDNLDLTKSYQLGDQLYLHWNLPQETLYYGFGERFNAILQQKGDVDTFVYSQYKDQGLKTYMPIPLCFTDQGVGFFAKSYGNTHFRLGKNGSLGITLDSTEDVLYVLQGDHANMIKQYWRLTGKPELLPPWSLGPWMSSNNWASQKDVLDQMNTTLQEDIPSSVLVIEQWSDEATFYQFNDAKIVHDSSNCGTSSLVTQESSVTNGNYEYRGRWPNPKGMVEKLHNNGLKCVLWQIPVIKSTPNLRNIQRNKDLAYAKEHGYLVKHADGTPYAISEDWFKESAIIDFTNPEAVQWWLSKRDYLLDEVGIDGFKTDGGECIFAHDIALYDGTPPNQARNRYAESYLQGYYQYGKARAQNNDTNYISFSRAGFSGAHTYPAHWAGDERSTFAAMQRTLVAGINASLSGIIYWGFDLGGFNGDIPTVDLYIRSTQFATFAPIMQYHAESRGEFNQDRTPWNIADRWNDTRALIVYRTYAHLRMQIIPYIEWTIRQIVTTGEPLMKPVSFDITDQYYFGSSLLVCPVMEEGVTSRQVYLPEGEYVDFFTLQRYGGAKWLCFEAPLDRFPLFLRIGEPLFLAPCDALGMGMSNDSWKVDVPMVVVTSADGCYKYEDTIITLENGCVNVNSCNYAGGTVSILDPLGVVREGHFVGLPKTFQWFDQHIMRYEVKICFKTK